jgi:penicillin-binding protein 1A
MQQMAELAVEQHMPRLQKEFFEQNKTLDDSIAPFRELTSGAVDTLLRISMRRSERWRKMKYDLKKDNEEIENSFFEPVDMTIFSWEGDIDTIMTPLDSMKYYKSFFRPGMMSMDPTNGHIKAWVGGMNYRHFQYDMVKKGKRQIGSTFKPFVYAAAIDQLKLSPCDTFPDSQFCIEKNKFGNIEQWCPKNSGDKYGRTRTLKNALANSVNTVTARLMDRIGPQTVVKLAKDLGIEQRILPVPSIALGTPDLSVYEMVAAYSTFANKGVYTQPVFVEKIEDKNGTTLFEHQPITKDVLSEEAAYVTVNLLEGVQWLVPELDLEQRELTNTTGRIKMLLPVILMSLQIQLQEKQVQPKIKVTVGLLGWFQIWLQVYGLGQRIEQFILKILLTAKGPQWLYLYGEYI